MKPLEQLKQIKLDQLKRDYPNVPEYAIPQPKYSDKSANGLTKCVIEWLQLNGWQAERINTMGRPIDNRKQVTDVIGRTKTVGSLTWGKSTATKGSADISATIMGRSVKLEVKYGKDRQSPEQKRYQEMIERSGGVYIIVRDFDTFHEWYKNFINGNK
jgi:hypothetical protein